jgi:hypothetical protein
MHISRHTSHFAVAAEILMRAGRRVCRNREGDDQQNLSAISEVNNGAGAQSLGRGPFDLPRVKAGGEFPLDARGLARVSGILPINMPAGVQDKVQADPGIFAWRDGVVFGHELDFRVLAVRVDWSRTDHRHSRRKEGET